MLIYAEFAGNVELPPVWHQYGWTAGWSSSAWTYLYYAYYLGIYCAALYLVVNTALKSADIHIRKQGKVLLLTAIPPFLCASASNVLAPLLGLDFDSNVGDLFILVLAGGLTYVMTRHRFLSITPTIAAEKIISTMSDALLLLDLDGNIVSVNRAATDLLGFDTAHGRGRAVNDVFLDVHFTAAYLSRITNGEPVRTAELTVASASGKRVPVTVAASLVPAVGIVCVIRDVTIQKNAGALQKSRDKLDLLVRERTEELNRRNEELRHENENRKEAEERLRESEERLKVLFDFAPIATTCAT